MISPDLERQIAVELAELKTAARDLVAKHQARGVALDDLQQAEAEYRFAHDHFGGGHSDTGRAWDRMRRAGDRARSLLNCETAK